MGAPDDAALAPAPSPASSEFADVAIDAGASLLQAQPANPPPACGCYCSMNIVYACCSTNNGPSVKVNNKCSATCCGTWDTVVCTDSDEDAIC